MPFSLSCRLASIPLGIGLFFSTPASSPAAVQFSEIPGQLEFTGRLIVRPVQPETWSNRGIQAPQAREHMDRARAVIRTHDVVRYIPQTDEYLVQVPNLGTESEVAESLMSEGIFQYATPDWRVFPIDCPDDSRFGSQWHHQANRMQSCDGWEIATGTPDVTVSICDTGIRTSHEDLGLHRVEGYNAVDEEWENAGGQIIDINGHGTATTGCAAANGDNGVGVSGVGWNLSHRMIRVSNSSGGSSSLGVLLHAARTAAENGDRVASLSYSGADSPSNLTTATYVKSLGALMVWAAGNDGRVLGGDRDADDLIVVGATDSNDQIAGFSARGSFVDLTAPGVSVYTTSNSSNSSYGGVSGTSFSTPLTAGLIGLIWSANPELSPDEVESALKLGATDLGSAGPDNTFGYGRINVAGSMAQTSRPLVFSFPNGLPDQVDPAGGNTIRVEVFASDSEPEPGSGLFHLDTGSGFVASPMVDLGDHRYDAVFPVLECGSNPRFYFSAETTDGELQTEPRSAPRSDYSSLAVNGLTPVYKQDFESNDGWTVTNVAIEDGAWDRGVPANGDRGDPAEDWDGSGQCFVTDNVAGNSDVDGGPTRLTSPTLDMSGGDGVIRYARWFTNDDGDIDRLDVEVSNDDGANWSTVESVPGSGGWVRTEFRVSDFVTPTGTVRIRFSATDNPNDSVTEAGLDAVEVLLFECDSAPLIALDVDPLEAGSEATARISDANAGEPIYFVYSLTGSGSTYVPQLDVTLDLDHPKLVGSATVGSDGTAEFTAVVPPQAAGRDLSIQAAQQGRKSNVVSERISAP